MFYLDLYFNLNSLLFPGIILSYKRKIQIKHSLNITDLHLANGTLRQRPSTLQVFLLQLHRMFIVTFSSFVKATKVQSLPLFIHVVQRRHLVQHTCTYVYGISAVSYWYNAKREIRELKAGAPLKLPLLMSRTEAQHGTVTRSHLQRRASDYR